MKNEHIKEMWKRQLRPVSTYTAAAVLGEDAGEIEHINLFNKYFKGFSGKILEIGPGTGWLAKQILSNYDNVEYTVLDIERYIPTVQRNLISYRRNVSYIKSSEYEKIFNNKYDLLIATNCLSETPKYYYTDILNNLSVQSCFIIDYGGPDEPEFDRIINEWFDGFGRGVTFRNYDMLGAKENGIPVYIGFR